MSKDKTHSNNTILFSDYTLFDPHSPSKDEQRILEKIASEDKLTLLKHYQLNIIHLLVTHGFKKIAYESHILESGHLFWINKKHAEQLARALEKSLNYFRLELSMLEDGAIRVFNEGLHDITIDEVFIYHRTGDEVSFEEAIGWADFITHVKARTFRLYAQDYEHLALEGLCERLQERNNHMLTEYDIRLIRLDDDTDQYVDIDKLDHLVRLNRKDYDGDEKPH